MIRRVATLSFLLLLASVAPLAAASHSFNPPPSWYSCVGGYNPSAYSNVCYTGVAVPSPTLTTRTTCVYVIGNIPGCNTHPYPSTGGISTPSFWVQVGCNPSTIHTLACTTMYLP